MKKTEKSYALTLLRSYGLNTETSNYPLQSMTNTDTNDVEATVAQIIELVDAGADLVRVAVPGMKEVESLRKTKLSLQNKNINIPIIADVHFLPEVAEKVACFVEKVRINPGNFTAPLRRDTIHRVSDIEYKHDFDTMALRAKSLFEICKKHNTIIRVGVNQGSLCERIISK
jgi:(E)-4-hydroxy-3-methylbut-2-enyl-diphosphate synthase